ncbi:Ig domain-containing protein [Desulforegula conservatrix]|uniref:Ig domain-containing protein n=1 Tax=Desulforegula conservatrix TaxID=153026 RepID=UPI000424937D|nr:Ig domain-containing protein [Desulforegula conservatrix]
MKIRLLTFMAILPILFLIGCDSVTRCAINAYEMTIYTDRLPVADVGVYYRAEITAGIDHNPNDDLYDYEFSYDGYLPDGLYISETDRELIISGVPKEGGTFNLNVSVTSHSLMDEALEEEYHNGFTCIDYKDKQSFALIVMGEEPGSQQ